MHITSLIKCKTMSIVKIYTESTQLIFSYTGMLIHVHDICHWVS